MSCCGKPAAIRVTLPATKPLVPIKPKPTQRIKVSPVGQSYNDRERYRV